MERLNKKGYELSALVGLAITFLIIAIVLSFGANIVDELQEEVEESSTTWVYNETVSSLGNDTKTILGGGHGLIDVSWIQTDAYFSNASEADESNTTEIIIYSDGYAAITLQRALEIGNDTDLNVTYSYNYILGTASYNTTEHGLESLDTFAGWLPTLALIVVAAVIIGIIVRYFAFR